MLKSKAMSVHKPNHNIQWAKRSFKYNTKEILNITNIYIAKIIIIYHEYIYIYTILVSIFFGFGSCNFKMLIMGPYTFNFSSL